MDDQSLRGEIQTILSVESEEKGWRRLEVAERVSTGGSV